MAKTKVRVLYPTAFVAAGIEIYDTDKKGVQTQRDEVELDPEVAEAFVAAGHAEKVAGKKT